MTGVSVNLKFLLLSACALAGCGPSPRPVPPLPPRDAQPLSLPDSPRVAWRNDLGSGLLATMTARGAALFATTTNRTVLAVAQQNGRRYWMQRFAGAVNTGALVVNNRVYFATADLRGQAVALDAARGRKLWTRRTGPVQLPPLLVDDHVYFASDGGVLYALHTSDGRVLWQSEISAAFVLPPVLVGGTLLTASAADSVYAITRTDGTIRQRARIPATPSAPALLAGDTLIIPLQNDAVIAVDANTLRVLYEVKLDARVLAQPRRIANDVYVLTRNAVLWRIARGGAEKVVDLEGAARGSLTDVDNRLVAGLLDGRVIALETNGRRVWEQQLPRSVVSPAVPSGSALFVPMINGEVWKLDR